MPLDELTDFRAIAHALAEVLAEFEPAYDEHGRPFCLSEEAKAKRHERVAAALAMARRVGVL